MKVFSWDIISSCNFNCDYCNSVGGAQTVPAPVVPEVVRDAWQRLYVQYGSSYVYITGGEPFSYPGFTDVVIYMARLHRLHITTNLSFPLDDFVTRADPKKISLNATFHPLHISCDDFKDQVLRLRNAGFECSVCYLAHPRQLREMLSFKMYFAQFGIHMTTTQFSGTCGGKQFPSEYSSVEIELLARVTQCPSEEMSEPSVMLSPVHDKHWFLPVQPRQSLVAEQLCNAGVTYANINVHGDVKRCGCSQSIPLGNIYLSTLVLLTDAQPCTQALGCSEIKYTSSSYI